MNLKSAFWVVLCMGLSFGAPAGAGDAASPAPAGHVIGVFGDSLGDGAWSGLYNTSKKHPHDTLFRHAKVGAGLTRHDFGNWISEFTKQLDGDKPDVAVVMFGANDQQGIRDENHKGYVFKSEGWKRTYGAHIDAMFAEFEKRKIAVVWLGLPIMRSKEMNEGAQFLNTLFAEKVKSHNGIFVPLIDDFKGPDGAFNTHYIDAKGKSHLLRAEDGVHFTGYGYELIADKAYAALSAPQGLASSAPVAATPAPAVVTPPATVPAAAADTPAAAPAASAESATPPATPPVKAAP